MDDRRSGRTGLAVSEVSLGAEHLDEPDASAVADTVAAAAAGGISLVDLTLVSDEGRALLEAGKPSEERAALFLACEQAGIRVGALLRLLDIAEAATAAAAAAEYEALSAHALDCTACLVCESRCPFGASAAARMEEAVRVFGR